MQWSCKNKYTLTLQKEDPQATVRHHNHHKPPKPQLAPLYQKAVAPL